jgi:proline dehydrogenase
MVDFSNTAIAFRTQSNRELARSCWLFRLMGYRWLVWLGTRLLAACLRLRLPIEWLVKPTLFRQFCGGETIDSCQATIARLAKSHIGTILDYSVEGKGSEAEWEATCQEIEKTIELAYQNPDIPFCVFKVTGVARPALLEKIQSGSVLSGEEAQEWDRAKQRVERLGDLAALRRVRLLVDAEETWIQNPIDDLTESMMRKHNRDAIWIYNTIQMYRVDRLAYLSRLLERSEREGFRVGVKPVRGAYMEKERARASALGLPSPIYPDKKGTDQAFDLAIETCLSHLDRVAICAGTHNEASIQKLLEQMQQMRIENDDPRIYFAQLLGMSDHLSYNLADAGYRVAKYVPYGPVRDVLPYLFRRAEENTSIAGQRSRELELLRMEKARRGLRVRGQTPRQIPL